MRFEWQRGRGEATSERERESECGAGEPRGTGSTTSLCLNAEVDSFSYDACGYRKSKLCVIFGVDGRSSATILRFY